MFLVIESKNDSLKKALKKFKNDLKIIVSCTYFGTAL